LRFLGKLNFKTQTSLEIKGFFVGSLTISECEGIHYLNVYYQHSEKEISMCIFIPQWLVWVILAGIALLIVLYLVRFFFWLGRQTEGGGFIYYK